MKNAHYQIAAWAALIAIVFVTVSPIQMRPGDIFSVDVDRALAFALLASMFMIAYPRQAIVVGSLVVVGAGAIELLQHLSATRHARFDDAVVKAGGAIAGMMFATVYNASRAARHKTNRKKGHTLRQASQTPAAAVPDGMTTLPVTSKLIEAVYFSPEDGKLRIRMHSGDERLFTGVQKEDADALVSAPSPGKYYVEQVRTKFPRAA